MQDCRVECFGDGERLPCFFHGRHDGVAGIAELPGKDRERERGLHDTPQGGIYMQAGAAQLVEVVRFLEGRIMRGQKAFQRFLRRLLTMKQGIFNQRGIGFQVNAGTT